MPTYAAFLRGVSPLNAKMTELKQCLEMVGFGDVKTVLGSGNVVFDSRAASRESLERKIETAMQKSLDRVFVQQFAPALHGESAESGYRAPENVKPVWTGAWATATLRH